MPGGFEAVQLRVAEQYVDQFGELAKEGNTLVVPANLADVGVDDRAGDERGAPAAAPGLTPSVPSRLPVASPSRRNNAAGSRARSVNRTPTISPSAIGGSRHRISLPRAEPPPRAGTLDRGHTPDVYGIGGRHPLDRGPH